MHSQPWFQTWEARESEKAKHVAIYPTGAPLAANVSALPMAAGAIGKAAQAANLGPKAAALAQALGMAGAGAAEGFALGEEQLIFP